MRISPPSMPSHRDGRWSTPSSPKCRRTLGSSFRGTPRCRSSRRSATARRDPSLHLAPPAGRGRILRQRVGAKRRPMPGSAKNPGEGDSPRVRARTVPLIPTFSPQAGRRRSKMPLQNRVTPSGDIIATPHRGMFTGNRGIIHDPATKTLTRRWASKAWLTCVCEFRGRRRAVMGGRSWTELFFLDEATALAAGHRPCFFCRRDDANRFRSAWEEGNDARGVLARDIDAVLHRERLAGGKKRLHGLPVPLKELPDGAMVQAGVESFLIARGRALAWSPARYGKAESKIKDATLLTPPSPLRALTAGYRRVLQRSEMEVME